MRYDLEASPIEIKTRSGLGDGDELWVYFEDTNGGYAGSLKIDWKDSWVYYYLDFCHNDRYSEPLPTYVPMLDINVLRITKMLEPHDRLKLHYNDVEVLDVKMSEYCDKSKWYQFWGKDVEFVEFLSSTSEFYRSLQGLVLNFIYLNQCTLYSC